MKPGEIYRAIRDLQHTITYRNHYILAGDRFEVLRLVGTGQWEVSNFRTNSLFIVDEAVISHCVFESSAYYVAGSPSLPSSGLPQGQPMGQSPVYPGLGAIVPMPTSLPTHIMSGAAVNLLQQARDQLLGAPLIYLDKDSMLPLKKCECGCASIGISNHSDYCPLYTQGEE